MSPSLSAAFPKNYPDEPFSLRMIAPRTMWQGGWSRVLSEAPRVMSFVSLTFQTICHFHLNITV